MTQDSPVFIPKAAQYSRKIAQDSPKTAQNSTKMAARWPKKAPRRPKMAARCPKTTPTKVVRNVRTPKTGPGDPDRSITRGNRDGGVAAGGAQTEKYPFYYVIYSTLFQK